MLCIFHNNTDPYFNIASEEYLLRNFSEDIFMLYRNDPSIIVGKHQNTFAEINHWFVKEKKITIIRRLSGGGTVFHDSGNLNFCFIQNGQEGNLINFKRFTQPIIDVLTDLGISAERSGRNDLIINGLKFSGNAEHVYKNRTLHHGTLLFSSQLGDLRDALKVNADLFQDKAVKSVRSKVTNIIDHLEKKISLNDFEDAIIQHITQPNEASPYEFTEADKSEIQRLITEKYATWEWNFGYSPKFIFRNNGIIDGSSVEIELEVEKGIIKQAQIKSEGKLIHQISQSLLNVHYKEDSVYKTLYSTEKINVDALHRFFF